MFSLASIATMSACIFLFGIFFAVVQNFQSIVKEAEEAVTMIVYFEKGTSQEIMDAAGEEIRSRDGVADVVFITAEEAWEEFKEIYFKERPELAEGFAADNPLVDYAHYEVYLDDVSLQADLVTYIESLEGVRRVRASQEVADAFVRVRVPHQQHGNHWNRGSQGRDQYYASDRSYQFLY